LPLLSSGIVEGGGNAGPPNDIRIRGNGDTAAFKLFVFTVKNLALNKRTRGHDLPSYCLNCTKFVNLIPRKIIEIVVTGCHVLKLKCNKFHFGWDSAGPPQTLLGELPRSRRAGFKETYF